MQHPLVAALLTLVMLFISGCASQDMRPTAGPALSQTMPSSTRTNETVTLRQPPSPLLSTVPFSSPVPLLSSTPTPLPQITFPPIAPEATATSSPIPLPLNEEVKFGIYAQFPGIPEFIAPDYVRPPTGTRYIIDIDVPCGRTGLTYAVVGELSEFKWHLAEYDALIQNCFRADMVGGPTIMGLFSEEQLQGLAGIQHRHYLYLQGIAYPQEIEQIHQLYLSCLLRPKRYWDIYDPAVPFEVTTPYWRINAQYYGYECQKTVSEANQRLFKLMEQEGVYPLIR